MMGDRLVASIPRQLVDNDYTAVCVWLNDFGITSVQKSTVIDAVQAVCAQQTFNPLMDYFRGIQKQYPADDKLARRIGCVNFWA